MRRRLVLLLVSFGLLTMSFGPPSGSSSQVTVEPAPGSILAPVARQAGWLSLLAPRPRLLTSFLAPSYVSDLAVSSRLSAVLAVQSFDPAREVIGGDLFQLDLDSGDTRPLVLRSEARESFGAPFWTPDGSRVFYQREDLSLPPTAYAGQAAVRFPSRIESVMADGAGRAVLQEAARQPAVSPDGTSLAYVRSSAAGTVLLVRSLSADSPDEREVVPAARFPDISYPRFSSDGDEIVFVAVQAVAARGSLLGSFFGPSIAYAHGLPWDLWHVRSDGTGLRLLAALGADDPSITWSPDGSQLFVYSGTGSFLIDAPTGDIAGYPYLAGYGATAWLP